MNRPDTDFANPYEKHIVELEKEIERLKAMLFHFTGKME